MGGGAGITLTLDLEPTFGVFRPRSHRITQVGCPPIRKFDMLGYEDGLANVRGDLLVGKRLVIPKLDRDCVRYLADHCGCANGDRLDLYSDSRPAEAQPRRTFWRGYIRGDIRKVFPMAIDLQLTIDAGYGERIAGCCLIVEATSRFFAFYKAVFRADEFVAADDEASDAQSELYWQDVRTEFGYSPARTMA